MNIPGIDYVGPIPSELQLIQTFAAARVANSSNAEIAQKLIEYLSSPNAAGPIQHGGMNTIR